MLFGPPAAITHSEQPVSVSVVRAALPSVGGSRGAEQGQEQGYEEEEEEDEDGLDSDEVRGRDHVNERSGASKGSQRRRTHNEAYLLMYS